MMLNEIERLAHFFTSGSRSTTDCGKFLTDEVLKFLDLINCYFWRLDNDGKLRYVGGYLKHDLLRENWAPIDLNTQLPVADCIRTQEIVWLNGPEEWESIYPMMNEFKLTSDFQTIINIPIKVEGHPIACWGISSSSNIKRTPELISYLTVIGGMTALFARNMSEFKSARQDGISRKVLSRRQNKILDLIREKLTNREIGEELGYSESTIRQETMRIYNILSVDNRREAAAFKFNED